MADSMRSGAAERPACQYTVKGCGKECDQAVVQVKPGGYKWKRDGDCWKYCYEEPCYEWCNKVVSEDGIEYCMEVPPEYRVEAYTDGDWAESKQASASSCRRLRA